MYDKFVITKEDIKTVRPTAELDDLRIEPYIKEAQQFDLGPVLGDHMFNDFMKEFDDDTDDMYTNYQTLINGTEYTVGSDVIYFTGLKPFLAYSTLARFVIANPVNITRFGFKVETGNPAGYDQGIIKAFVNDLKSNASALQHSIIKYLEDNSTTYTTYKRSNSGAHRQTGFNFFKL